MIIAVRVETMNEEGPWYQEPDSSSLIDSSFRLSFPDNTWREVKMARDSKSLEEKN